MTDKQRAWLQHFNSGESAENAAKLAGYKKNFRAMGQRNSAIMKKENFVDDIKNFWESVINDDEISIQHRLKASELRLKIDDSEDVDSLPVVFISGEDEIEE